MSTFSEFRQAWPRPSRPLPIVMVGTGGIVEHAHLPTYRRLGFEVKGVYDLDAQRSADVAERFAVNKVYASLDEAAGEREVIFDLAVPAAAIASVLEKLPERAAVLIQKPLGENLEQARAIAGLCRDKSLVAAVNFQLRYSPNILALTDVLERGLLGEPIDLEVRINTETPWQRWEFLRGIARLELLYHSIHYLDLVRALLGEPRGVLCRALGDPALIEYAETRSATILDYGARCRVLVSANHGHRYGSRHAMSALKLEGTRGAAVAELGVNLDYPEGRPDTLELALGGEPTWQTIPLRGSWFIEAFEGPMSNLQRFVLGEDSKLCTSVDDALKTMAVVEACYLSTNAPATPILEV